MDKTGEVIFQNTEDGECEIKELYTSTEAKKDFPKKIQSNYSNDDMKVQFTVESKQELEVRTPENIFGKIGTELVSKFDAMGLDPSYIRYQSDAELVITTKDNVRRYVI